MSKLNEDILFLIFEELQDNLSESLFSCLMVNRVWSETAISLLWKDPWGFANHRKISSLYYVITYYLTDDLKEFLTRRGIQLPSHKPLLFDYLSLCKSISTYVIDRMASSASPSGYNKFLLQREFCSVLIRKCSEFKYLDMRSMKHQIFYFPEAKVRLGSLCELECDTSIESSYFYGLAGICQNIQKLKITNECPTMNYGIGMAKLIEAQENLKYFEWNDCFDEDEYYYTCHYKELFLGVAKKADTLKHLVITFQSIKDNLIYMQDALPKFHKLKTLEIYGFTFGDQLKELVYHDIEVFKISDISIDTAVCMIENNGNHLKKILIQYEKYDDDVSENSLILIRTVYENCPSVEYLSLIFSPSDPIEEYFTEFEKLLKICKNLKSLLLVYKTNERVTRRDRKRSEYEEKLLEILIRSAPTNLREISFNFFGFSLESLETFFEKWRGRPSLSIFTTYRYSGDDYVELINKYKSDGVIKDFKSNLSEYSVYFETIPFNRWNLEELFVK